MSIRKIRILIITIIVLIVPISGFLLIEFKNYNYLKSKEMKIVRNGMFQYLRIYYNNYYKYPDTGNAFIEYLEMDNEFYNQIGVKIPEIIKNRQIKFLTDTVSNNIIVFCCLDNNNRKIHNISDLSFINYIMGDNFMLFNDQLLDICYWSNYYVKIYRNSIIIHDDIVKQKIRKILKLFIIRNTLKKPIDISMLQTFYFYGKVKDGDLRFSLVCDPLEGVVDCSSINDSLSLLLNGIINKNSITELYVPLRIHSEYTQLGKVSSLH